MFKLFLVGLGILALDMSSKGIIHLLFKPFELASPFFPFGGIAVFQKGGVDFCIHHVTNRGVAWGMGESWQMAILFIRCAIVLGLAIYLRLSAKAYLQRYGLMLIMIGGIGNILDYFIYGHVVDMFHFIFWGYSYPVFNIADSAIFCGIAALLWTSWKTSRNDSPKPDVLPQN